MFENLLSEKAVRHLVELILIAQFLFGGLVVAVFFAFRKLAPKTAKKENEPVSTL